jgi:hypothetical protein
MALEAAVAELGALYTVARTFTVLATRAEGELLPRVTDLGSRMRAAVRRGQLGPSDIDAASAEVLDVRAEWRAALAAVRASPPYQRALAAFAADRQEELATLIPQIFVGLRPAQVGGDLYFPASVSTGRRRPGHSPFLGAAECAEHVLALLAGGLVPESGGPDWWDQDLPFLACADTPAAFDTPLCMRLRRTPGAPAVFATQDEPTLRVYTPRLQAPMVPVLAAEATDEWWNAYAGSYTAFREGLRSALAARGVEAQVRAGGG